MKKVSFLCLCLVFVLSMGALHAGGQGEAAEEAAEEKVIELSYWGWGPHVTTVNGAAGPAYEKEHPNVKVKGISMGPWDLMDKFYTTMVSGRGMPDCAQLVRRVSEKYLIPELMWDFTDFLKQHEGQFIEALNRDVTAVSGQILGVAFDYGPSVVFYNNALTDRFGVDVDQIVTWDDYYDTAKRISNSDPNTYAQFVFYPAGSWGTNYWRLWAQSYGANIYDDDGKVIRDNQDLVKVTRFYHKLMTTTNSKATSPGTPDRFDAIKNGQVVFWPKNSYESGRYPELIPEMAGKISAFPWPLWSESAPKTTGNWGGVALVVPKRGPNAEAAAEFIKFFSVNETSLQDLWYTTGGVPAYRPVREGLRDVTDRSNFVKNALESIIARDVPAWNYTDWSQTEKILGDALDTMIKGDRTPEETMEWTEGQLTKILGR